MQIIKHYVIFLLSFILLLGGISYAKEIPTIYFFYGKGCPHCSKEETFLENLQKNEKTLNIQSYEVWNNTENAQLLSRIGQKLKITRFGVPMTIIGEQVIIGFQNEKTTGQEILEAFSYCKNNPCKDIIAIEQDKNN